MSDAVGPDYLVTAMSVKRSRTAIAVEHASRPPEDCPRRSMLGNALSGRFTSGARVEDRGPGTFAVS
jgi:hypothetical protein